MPTIHEPLSAQQQQQQHYYYQSHDRYSRPVTATQSSSIAYSSRTSSDSHRTKEEHPRTVETTATHRTTESPIVFTRQLWQRRMPDEPTDVPVVRQDQASSIVSETPTSDSITHAEGSSRRTRLHRPPVSPTTDSKTPLTPEESPPYRMTRKRTSSTVEEEERAYRSIDPSPTHSRADSGDQTTAQVCICQPDPKIPRPRNAFILYRQHHQAKVIAEHPGLANPEISKIIGEQWRNQPADIKNEWKQLAEEEKVRHQQQYPAYRYQPRRNIRRGSVPDTASPAINEKARCPKCGGRTVLASSSFSGPSPSPSGGNFPGAAPSSSTTPVSRTLPVLGDLSLQSPAARQLGRPEMSPRHVDERDDGQMSPDAKRRRFNNEQPMMMYRTGPPRYQSGNPGTPYPFPQAQYSPHQPTHPRRESLPSLHMMGPPGPMAPPPRPGMGYQQHRMSLQGNAAHDRSLILPPLQTGSHPPAPPSARSIDSRPARDVIMTMPLSEKLEVLRRIAPPAKITRASNRGPLIAIEGDDVDAVKDLAQWLVKTLEKESDLSVKLVDSPDVKAKAEDEFAMAEYHVLAAEWLAISRSITNDLTYALPTTPVTTESSMSMEQGETSEKADTPRKANKEDVEMIDKAEEVVEQDRQDTSTGHQKKPVLIIPAYSLHATNVFSCRIPITDVYSPKEHWQWSATLWRGIIGPDLTIYIRDVDANDSSLSVEHSEGRLFIVKRVKAEGGDFTIESSTLRRVGFEVSEWIKAHGVKR